MGRYKDTIASYEKALELQPQSSGTHCWKAYYYVTQHQVDLAITNLKHAIDLNPKHRELATIDSNFDTIRTDERFKMLLETNA